MKKMLFILALVAAYNAQAADKSEFEKFLEYYFNSSHDNDFCQKAADLVKIIKKQGPPGPADNFFHDATENQCRDAAEHCEQLAMEAKILNVAARSYSDTWSR